MSGVNERSTHLETVTFQSSLKIANYFHFITGKARMSSLITSVAGLPVCSQYFSRFLASLDAKFTVIRLTAHFLFMLKQLNRVLITSKPDFTFPTGK